MSRNIARIFHNPWVIWFLRFMLSAVFLIASIPKIINPHDFAFAIFRYQIFPSYFINLLAIFVPWLEFTIAIALLLWKKGRIATLIIIISLLCMFTIMISSSLARGIDIACGCFSVKTDATHIGWINIVRNFLLISISILLLYYEIMVSKNSNQRKDCY